MDSQDTLCHQVHLNHLKWQKATPTASCEHSPHGSQELGKEVNREHQQHRECRSAWEGKNTTTKVPHIPLKAQPSYPPLESATLFPQQQHQRSHYEGNCFLYTFSQDKLGQHLVPPPSEHITTFPPVPCLPQTQAVTCKSGWLLT